MHDVWDIGDRLIDFALEEDVGSGDITTRLTVDSDATGTAILIVREDGVLAGLDVFKRVFRKIDPEIRFDGNFMDGDILSAHQVVSTVYGSLLSILKAERTALNFLQRMSGIATLTRRYVEKVSPFDVKILDTRKTAPGLRWFDKYAVRVGGGTNHRFGLFDGVLIKDNHIVAAGSVEQAVKKAKSIAPHTLKIEVEVEDIKGVKHAVDAGADIIMLDNMSVETMKQAVQIISGRAITEASGGVNLDTVADIASTGVNFISVGDLTHSAAAIDFSLDISS